MKKEKKYVRKIQVIVYRLKSSPEYLLLQRPPELASLWQPITGHVESGETEEQAARREMYEEMGVTVKKVLSLGNDFSFKKRGNNYVERVYAVKIGNAPITLSKEHVAYRWVSYPEAVELLPYETQRKYLGLLEARLQQKGRSAKKREKKFTKYLKRS